MALAGCSTPGVLHTYTLAASSPAAVRDQEGSVDVPSFLEPGDQLVGFAYDPFTDHFFLRLAPGNRIRVVDRPARAIKRELTVSEPDGVAGGDLAVKPRDGHIFLLHATQPAVIETTRLGKFIRTLPLAATARPPRAIAYDSGRDELLVASDARPTEIAVHDLTGQRLRTFSLERAIAGSLAFDAEKRELFAPLAAGASIIAGGGEARGGRVAVFDENGKFLRELAFSADFVDAGPRAFIRVF